MFIVFQRKELWSSLGMNSLYATFFNHLSTFNHKLLLGYYCRFGQFVFGKLSYLPSILDEMLNSWGLEVWYLTMSKITCFERTTTTSTTTTTATTTTTKSKTQWRQQQCPHNNRNSNNNNHHHHYNNVNNNVNNNNVKNNVNNSVNNSDNNNNVSNIYNKNNNIASTTSKL